MYRLILLLLFSLASFLTGRAQGEFNNWLFGMHTSISWNTGIPVLQPPTTLLYSSENVTVSDSAGNLLFYCEGDFVRNKNLQIMPHGWYMNGGSGSYSQTVLSVPDQLHPKKHFLFTSGTRPNEYAEYSLIDMTLEGGLGDVDINVRRVPLIGSRNTMNGIGGTRAANNIDTWIVFKKHEPDTNFYLSYKVTDAGVINNPVFSPSLYNFSNAITAYHCQQIKMSHDGKYLVACYYSDTLEICDFNKETGYVTSRFIVHYPNITNQIEFSTNSRYLYFLSYNKVCQADMSILDSAQFVNHIIEVSPHYDYMTTLQIAVDGKIYIGEEQYSFLSVINNPNEGGVACNFVYNALTINNPCLSQGFPDFIQRYKAYFQSADNCGTVTFTSDIWPPADSIVWNFGDPASGSANVSALANPVHTFSSTGTYLVSSYVRHNDNRRDTTWKTITVGEAPHPQLGPDRTICSGNTTILDAGTCPGCSYQWTNLTTGLPVGTGQTYTATQAGNYKVLVTNPGGCSGTDTIQVTLTAPPVINNPVLAETICSGQTTNIVPTSTNPNAIYHWTPTLTSGTVTGFTADSGTIISQTLLNPGPGAGIVTYTVIPEVGSCLGTPEDFTVTVNPGFPVSITVTATDETVCAGNSVTFTASAVTQGQPGNLQWKVNNINAGTGLPTFTYTPANGDAVTCSVFVPNASCLSNNPATSVPIIITVNPLNPVDITVTPFQNNVCQGTPVTFTASATPSGGIKNYQWTVNSLPAGSDLPAFTYAPLNNDVVKCQVTVSSLTCLTNNPKTSQPVTMVVNPNVTTGVAITAAPNPVCSGIPVTFTATPVNGGTPVYQWQVNGANAGTGLSNFTYSPANGDMVTCSMTTSLSCALPVTAISNSISMSVIASPVVNYTQCTDTITTLNAKPIKLKGGIPLGGTYSGPGVNSVTGIFTPSLAGTGNKTITYSYTNAASCTDSKSRIIKVIASPVFSCGNTLTDIRDGITYRTVQIGSQCWMAEDLAYGTSIPQTTHQRDNCIAEKYDQNVPPLFGGGQVGAYQWDELMDYSSTPGEKGLCPPGWHVPTEAEWQTMFSNYTNNAFAGAALKYSGFSGFSALMSGFIPQNTISQYHNFAIYYWTSSAVGLYKAWSHGMNETDPSVSVYPSSRQNAFSVRCLKD